MEDVSTYNFSTALSWMKQGRKVARQKWLEFACLYLVDDSSFEYSEDGVTPTSYEFVNEDILANDWMDAQVKPEPVVEDVSEETKVEGGEEEVKE